ncbi:MAG: pyridoxal phosphate-dependent aminotransferase [bacterium]|nr:pyridoxal phosphate-dependent aminotransferase [bacterium]
MKIARRVQNVQESLTLALTAKAKAMKAEGIDVVSFGAGEPDFDTPERIKRRAIDEITRGNTKYTPASGTVELKKAVADKLRRDQGLAYDPAQIIINCGAKHSLYNVFMTLVDDGDEVIIPAPYWLTYPEQVTMAGGKIVFIETGVAQNFKITPQQLEAAITPRTVALLLNSPSNPTGMLYTRGELEALAAVLERHPGVTIVSDEIYEKLIYGGERHVSPAQLSPSLKERTLLVNGMSKAYSMTGWRIGYVAGALDFIKAMGRLQSHSTSNPTTFCMPASITALEECEDDTRKMVAAFDERRVEIVRLLNAIPGVACPEPRGAFYAFPDVSALYKKRGVDGSIAFCEKLLAEAKVNCIPGAPFGEDRCIRLSYATSMKNIQEGLRRLAEYLK